MSTKPKAKTTTKPALPPRYEQLHAMLIKASGATISELMDATGWQRHSARGVLSTAQSRYGWKLEKDSDEDRGTVYRLIAAAASDSPKVKAAKPKAAASPKRKPKAKVAAKPKSPAAPRKTKPVDQAVMLIDQPTI
jgi:hypothetical protein